MADPRKVQGSDADRAEGGLDPEAEFAELDKSTSVRLSREAQAQATGNIEQQIKNAPGGKGAAFGRDDFGR